MLNNAIPGLDRPWAFQEVEAPRFQDSRHMNVVMLSALRTGRLYPPGNIPRTHFCQRLSPLQGHSATRRITSVKNSNDTIGNRTCDLPACSAVPQPTAPPRAPPQEYTCLYILLFLWNYTCSLYTCSLYTCSLLLNPSNAELNPICHLLALLRAHPILHVSTIRFKFLFSLVHNV